MTRTAWLRLPEIAFIATVLVASTGRSQTAAPGKELPDPVAKTFKTTFPEGEILKMDAEKEEGVTVYDLEFKDGAIEKETDIAADGTMLESTVVVAAEAVPAAAMKTIRKAAEKATIKRLEHIEVTHETRDGRVVRLPKVETKYSAEMAKGNQSAEVVVTPTGTVIDPAEWVAAKEVKAEVKTSK